MRESFRTRMREPLCICWASLTSGIVSRAAVLVVTEGAAEGPVIPVPAPVLAVVIAVAGVVVVVLVGTVLGAVGLLTLPPISKDAKEKKR